MNRAKRRFLFNRVNRAFARDAVRIGAGAFESRRA